MPVVYSFPPVRIVKDTSAPGSSLLSHWSPKVSTVLSLSDAENFFTTVAYSVAFASTG